MLLQITQAVHHSTQALSNFLIGKRLFSFGPFFDAVLQGVFALLHDDAWFDAGFGFVDEVVVDLG